MNDLNEQLARLAYREYGSVTDFKNYQGLPMPEFDALPPTIKKAWLAASAAVYAKGLLDSQPLER